MSQAPQNGPNGSILWNPRAEECIWRNGYGCVPMNIYDIDTEFHRTFFICHKILLLSSFSPPVIKSCEHGLLFVIPWTIQNQAVSQIGPTGRVDGQALSVVQGTKTDRCFLVSGILTAACFHAGLPVVIGVYCKTLHAQNIVLINSRRKILQASLWESISRFTITYWFTWTFSFYCIREDPDWKIYQWGI